MRKDGADRENELLSDFIVRKAVCLLGKSHVAKILNTSSIVRFEGVLPRSTTLSEEIAMLNVTLLSSEFQIFKVLRGGATLNRPQIGGELATGVVIQHDDVYFSDAHAVSRT